MCKYCFSFIQGNKPRIIQDLQNWGLGSSKTSLGGNKHTRSDLPRQPSSILIGFLLQLQHDLKPSTPSRPSHTRGLISLMAHPSYGLFMATHLPPHFWGTNDCVFCSYVQIDDSSLADMCRNIHSSKGQTLHF